MSTRDWGHRLVNHHRSIRHTNHTLLPEALETWGVDLSSGCCPATADHLEIQQPLSAHGSHPATPAKRCLLERMSLISEGVSARCAHGQPGGVGKPPRQNRGRGAATANCVRQPAVREFAGSGPSASTTSPMAFTPRRWIAVAKPPSLRPAR